MENGLRSYIQRTRQHNLENPDDPKVMRFSNVGPPSDEYADSWRPDKQPRDAFVYDEDKFTAETEKELQTHGTGFDYTPGSKAPEKPRPATPPEDYKPPDFSPAGRDRFQDIVFKQIGGNPFGYDPMEVVQQHMTDENLEGLFKQVFGGAILYADRDQLDPNQAKHWQQNLQAYRAHVYDQAASHKNAMVEQYKFMMGEFDARAQNYTAAREKIEKQISEAQASVDKKIGAILEARYSDENGKVTGDISGIQMEATKKAYELVGNGTPEPEAVQQAIDHAEKLQQKQGAAMDAVGAIEEKDLPFLQSNMPEYIEEVTLTIEDALDMGATPEQVRQRLSEAGWKPNEIKKHFAGVLGGGGEKEPGGKTQKASEQPGTAGAKVTRTGMYNGKKLIMYEDGTATLDGQPVQIKGMK